MDGAIVARIVAALAQYDPIDLIVEALALIALLIAIISLRRSQPRSSDLEAQTEELRLKITELTSQLSKAQNGLNNELKILRDRLIKLDLEGLEVSPEKEAEAPPHTIETGLQKTRRSFFTRLQSLFRERSSIPEDLFAGIEELLISSDLGVKTTTALLDRLRERAKAEESFSAEELRRELKSIIEETLSDPKPPQIIPNKREGLPLVIVVVGVNGVGKTTTIAKLAHLFVEQGKRVLLAAGDTFRAAAGEQLDYWAKRSGAEILMASDDAKPSTVAYQAVHRAKGKGFDVLIIDTAGRLHTRVNLMNELSGVVQLIAREQPGAPHETLLVLDASTGQNALQQAREFNEICKLSGIIVTKLDGTPKGGIVVAIKSELGIPIRYIGVGEGINDLKVFSAENFAEALLAPVGNDENAVPLEEQSVVPSDRARNRRRRKSLPQADG